MYSKEEKKILVKEFWTKFGVASKPFLIANGKGRWLTYDTKMKGIEFKFDAERSSAKVLLECNHKNEDYRLACFELLHSYRAVLNCGLTQELSWELIVELPNGKSVSRAELTLHSVDILRKTDWPEIFQFFMKNMFIIENNFLDISDALREELNNFKG